MAVVLIVAGGAAIVALVIWGRRIMQQANEDKAWVLEKLRGKHVQLGVPGGNTAVRAVKGTVVRVEDDTVILKAGDKDRAIPLGAVRDIRHGNRCGGRGDRRSPSKTPLGRPRVPRGLRLGCQRRQGGPSRSGRQREP